MLCPRCSSPMKPLFVGMYCPKDCDKVSTSNSEYSGKFLGVIHHPTTHRAWDVVKYSAGSIVKVGWRCWNIYKNITANTIKEVEELYTDTDDAFGWTDYKEEISKVEFLRFVPSNKEDIAKYPEAI